MRFNAAKLLFCQPEMVPIHHVSLSESVNHKPQAMPTPLWVRALRGNARMAVRQKGAGAQMLLEMLLARAGASPAHLNRLEPPCLTGPDLAAAIRAGRADCGIATRSAARAPGIDFVPLLWEEFDLVMRQRIYFQPSMQALLGFFARGDMAIRAAELSGYDVTPAGTIRFSS
ncbi:hypothetical protein GA829_32965 (plasmid) [Mesorhizobium sp. INR15]|nr:hypothetical protein GA829_32965 [Mesorhizobium sp. INR15]